MAKYNYFVYITVKLTTALKRARNGERASQNKIAWSGSFGGLWPLAVYTKSNGVHVQLGHFISGVILNQFGDVKL
jgi:hypothetical protein